MMMFLSWCFGRDAFVVMLCVGVFVSFWLRLGKNSFKNCNKFLEDYFSRLF